MARQGGRGAFGPYPRGKRFFVLVRAEQGGSGSYSSFATRDEAARFQEDSERTLQISPPQARTVDDAIEAYAAHIEDEGHRQAGETEARVRRFFDDVLEEPLSALGPRRCVALYKAACERKATVRSGPRKKPVRVETDRLVSTSTQRGELQAARTFLGWVVSKKWLRTNPLAGVKPKGGRKGRGKKQLRIDEARAWLNHALALAPKEPGAVAALCALLLGMRGGEIVSREARDLDDAGSVLWVDETEEGWRPKTEAGKRAIGIPAVLRPHLMRMAAKKESTGRLFQNSDGTPHLRGWVLFWTKKICVGAGVPKVSAHALRGVFATIAVQRSAPEIVAETLGHESAKVTRGHYAQPGSVEAGERERGLKLLRGGKKR